jgi:endo-1,4-beta-D-glucanase Y
MNSGTYLLNHDYNDPTIGTNEEGFVHVSDALEDYARVEKIEMLERLKGQAEKRRDFLQGLIERKGKAGFSMSKYLATGRANQCVELIDQLEEELSKLKA